LGIGGPQNNSNQGAAWIFTDAVVTTTTASPTTTTTAAPAVTTTTAAPIIPVPSSVKSFTLTNTGKIPLVIQSMTFTDPPGIVHTVDLSNLGGGSAVTANQIPLAYSLRVGAPATFTVDYQTISAPIGTYSGQIVINGKFKTTQTINSTVVVNARPTTTTTPAPIPPNTRIEPCNTLVSFSGGITFPSRFLVDFGDNTAGAVTFTYNAFSVPDRFVVVHNGVVQIDTGYVGEPSLLGNVNTALSSLPSSTVTDGVTITHPTVTSIGANDLTTGITFTKVPSQRYATILIFAPIEGTAWECKLTCAASLTTTTAAPMPSTIANFGLWLYDVDNADNSSYGKIVLKLNVKPNGQWAVSSSTQYGPPQYHSWQFYSIPASGDTKPDANNLVGQGTGALNESGLWFNSITPGIGNNYWVRFSGHAFVSGVDFFGYDAASPTNITNRSGPSANVPFNSGWLSLSAERTVQIQDPGGTPLASGTQVFGAAYGLYNPFLATWTGSATVEIATDSGGTNIVQTTKFGIYLRYRATYPTGTPP
jgi:hypothetical protein